MSALSRKALAENATRDTSHAGAREPVRAAGLTPTRPFTEAAATALARKHVRALVLVLFGEHKDLALAGDHVNLAFFVTAPALEAHEAEGGTK